MIKINKISDVTKIILFAATVLIVCILCAVGFKMANEGKSSVTSGTKKYNEMASKQASTDIAVYDGSTVLGSELQRIIKQTIDNEDYLSIRVITGSATTNYNYVFNESGNTMSQTGAMITVPEDKSDKGYINPDVMFSCNLIKDSNSDVVLGMSFKQIN